ncbi:MAG: hypothetical protein AUJ55_13160 [Proteobacteria bacterium CG1_02_64_396]|nr:MAG: hypothetical protein AUJ55_13160 [Proteobacteria bacterium CG1_02_64_396]
MNTQPTAASTPSKPTVYLITAATQQRKPLFADLWAARHVVREMRALHDSGQVISLSWVLLPDRRHWLIALKDPVLLPALVWRLKEHSAKAIRSQLDTIDPIWNATHHNRRLRPDQEVLHIARKMMLRPIKRQVARRLEDFSTWDSAWV